MRVDAHHHVWRRTTRGDGARATVLDRDFTIEDLRPQASLCGIERTVLVQTVGDIQETRDLLALADREALIAGVVGWVDLAGPDVAADLDRLRAGPGGSKLVGIRHQIPREPRDGLRDSPLVRGLRAVADRGLLFDLLITPAQLSSAIVITSVLPELRFAVDHMAKPDVAGKGFESWRPGFTELARRDNVAVKLSGLLTQLDQDNQGPEALASYVSVAVGSFGPERIMYGSDWPLCEPAGGYRRTVDTTADLIANLSTAQRDRIMGGTACEWYGFAGGDVSRSTANRTRAA